MPTEHPWETDLVEISLDCPFWEDEASLLSNETDGATEGVWLAVELSASSNGRQSCLWELRRYFAFAFWK